MQHEIQHTEAINKTLKVRNEVRACIFDDKLKNMGYVVVENGNITIKLDYVPSMVSPNAKRDFVVDAISLSLKACFDAKSEAFCRSISAIDSLVGIK